MYFIGFASIMAVMAAEKKEKKMQKKVRIHAVLSNKNN